MFATCTAAGLVCVGSLLFGQAIVRLCGAAYWTWLSAPVGLAAMILVAVASLHAPGGATTTAVLLAVLLVVAAVWVLGSHDHRPPLAGLAGAVPVALLSGVPFAAAGRAGTLGWSFDNDMAAHLLLADGYRSSVVRHFNALLPDYPLGPHALVGVIAQGTGTGVDAAFAGLSMASVILLGLTGLSAVRAPRWWAAPAVCTVVGMPFLAASYYAEGSFKETLQATFVLGIACALLQTQPPLRRHARWIPVALIAAGSVSVYSVPGLAWPVALLGVWLLGTAVRTVADHGVAGTLRCARGGLLPVLAGAGLVVVVLVPQIPRIHRFLTNDKSHIPKTDIGNLAGRLPVWEAFGGWGSGDFRFGPPDALTNGVWVGVVLALVVFGAVWAIHRREYVLVAATTTALIIWALTDRSQSPYVAAKALVILAPLLMVLAIRPLVERDRAGVAMPAWWWLAAPLLAGLLLFRVGDSSWRALRQARVGPTDHTRELRALQPTLDHRPTLFLGNDDFLRWELDETPVQAPVVGLPVLPFRPEKPWTYGRNYDVDSLPTDTLNTFDWVIAPRDAASSEVPAELRLVRRTRNFLLYRRTATIAPRSVLAEGGTAAAKLDCRTAAGQAIVRGGGVASVRAPDVVAAVPALGPGDPATVSLPLGPGRWDLVSTVMGPRPIRVTARGLDTTLVANLDRPGPRWPVGRVTGGTRPLVVTLTTEKKRWTPDTDVDPAGELVAVRVGAQRTVPIRQACGKLVDWYRPR